MPVRSDGLEGEDPPRGGAQDEDRRVLPLGEDHRPRLGPDLGDRGFGDDLQAIEGVAAAGEGRANDPEMGLILERMTAAIVPAERHPDLSFDRRDFAEDAAAFFDGEGRRRDRLPIDDGDLLFAAQLEAIDALRDFDLAARGAHPLARIHRAHGDLHRLTGGDDLHLALEVGKEGENAVEAKEEGFKAGLTTNLDVLDAQRDLSRSQKDYLQARYDYILSTLSLERVTGQLDEDDISRINGWLGESAKVSWRPEINPEFVSVIPELGFEIT